jgi:hypothetical protein
MCINSSTFNAYVFAAYKCKVSSIWHMHQDNAHGVSASGENNVEFDLKN